MFTGRGDGDSDAAGNADEQTSTKRGRREKKRRRDEESHSRARTRRTMEPASERGTQSEMHQTDVASLHSSRSIAMNELFPNAASLMPEDPPNEMFDPRFNVGESDSQRRILHLALANNLMRGLPPTNSILPNPASYDPIIAVDLLRLEQQRILDMRSAEILANSRLASAFPAASYNQFAGTLMYPPQPGLDAQTGSLFDSRFDTQLPQFGVHPYAESSLLAAAQHSMNWAQLHDNEAGHSRIERQPDFASLVPDLTSLVPNAAAAICSSTPRQNDNVARKSGTDGGGLILFIPQDRRKLNENQIFLRKQLEAFPASDDDLSSQTHGKSKPIALGQVGIRCRHCSHLPVIRRNKASTYFPSNLMGIYQAAQNISVEHLQSGLCPSLPLDIKDQFSRFGSRKILASCGGKKYWAYAAELLGLVDTDAGIRFAADVRDKAKRKVSDANVKKLGKTDRSAPN